MTQTPRTTERHLLGTLLACGEEWPWPEARDDWRRIPWWVSAAIVVQLAVLVGILGWLVIARPV